MNPILPSKRRRFSPAEIIIVIETAIILSVSFWILCDPYFCVLTNSPISGLKKIHDLALQARQDGKKFSKADVENEVAALKKSSDWVGNVEITGTDSHWTVLVAMRHERQTKFQMLFLQAPEWPVYVLSSDDDGLIEISPYGKITRLDFNW